VSAAGAVARRTAVAVAGGTAALGALVVAQARHATRRGDLPVVVDAHASGTEEFAGASRALRLAAAGDSTLTGPGLADPRDIWIRQVARWVASHEHAHVEVTSFAVTGSRVRDVVTRQLDPLLATAPDVVVVAVGTNDAIHLTPLRRVEADFRTLVARLVAEVPAVVIGGVGDLGGIARVGPPLADVLRARGRAVNRVIRAAAERGGAHYIDVSTVDLAFRHGGAAVFSADLFHPNQMGHALWANTAAPVVGHAVRTAHPRPRL
jgi:lysophospholipase L1-like esterase